MRARTTSCTAALVLYRNEVLYTSPYVPAKGWLLAKSRQKSQCFALTKLRIHREPEAPALLMGNTSTYPRSSRFCFCGDSCTFLFSCFCSGKTHLTNWSEAPCLTWHRNPKFQSVFWKGHIPLQTLPLLLKTPFVGKANACMAYSEG